MDSIHNVKSGAARGHATYKPLVGRVPDPQRGLMTLCVVSNAGLRSPQIPAAITMPRLPRGRQVLFLANPTWSGWIKIGAQTAVSMSVCRRGSVWLRLRRAALDRRLPVGADGARGCFDRGVVASWQSGVARCLRTGHDFSEQTRFRAKIWSHRYVIRRLRTSA